MGEADDLPDPVGLILYVCMILGSMKMRNKRLGKQQDPPEEKINTYVRSMQSGAIVRLFRFLSPAFTN